MKSATRSAILGVAAAVFAAAVSPAVHAGESSRGGAFLPLGWDAKGLSLGGAATVRARGVECAYWNPANRVYVERAGASVGTVRLVEGLPSRYSTFSAAIGLGEPASDSASSRPWHRLTVALSASQLGLELAEGSGWSESTLGLSASYAFTPYSAIGVTARALRSATDIADADAWGWAVDIGVTERLTRRLWFGVSARDVASRISYPERSESLDPLWNIAFAATDLPGRVSAEFDIVLKRGEIDRLLAGAEIRVYEEYLVVAGGVDMRLIEGERTIPSFGFGTSYGFAELFAGFSFDPLDAFGRRTHLTLGVDF